MEVNMAGILEAALEQGIWAALYIYLFFRMLKESAQREERYQQIIDELNRHIKSGIDTIQNQLDGLILKEKHLSAKPGETGRDNHYVS